MEFDCRVPNESFQIIGPNIGGNTSSRRSGKHNSIGVGEVKAIVDVLEMSAGIDCTPEVQFGILIAIGLLGHALMEGSITIEDDDLGPVGE